MAADLRDEAAAASVRQRWAWGLLAAAVAVLVSVFSGGFFIYAALVVAALLGLSTALASSSIAGLQVRRSLSATEIPVGGVVEGRLELHNRKGVPALWLFWRDQIAAGLDLEGVSCAFRSLGAGETVKLDYRLHSTRRGLFRIGPAVVEAGGPFGLVRRFLVDGEALFVTVLPRSIAVGRGWPLGHRPIHEVPRQRSFFEDPTRFLGVREYRPGDSLRRVHWRATAKSGRLQVKLFEPAVLEGLLLAVDMGTRARRTETEAAGGPVEGDPAAGDPVEELTVTAAASLADLVLGGGQKVGLLSNGADAAESHARDWTGGTFRRLGDALAAGSERKITGYRPLEVEPDKGSWQRQRLFIALARLVPATGPSLAELLHVELPRLPRSLVLMVVTPRLDPALAATLAELRRSGFELGVVWIGGRSRGKGTPSGRPPALPAGIPVYAVASEEDLMALGGQRL